MTTKTADVFALAEQRLSWIDQRQAVLAQNIANVNTPGFASSDVQPFSTFLAAQANQAAGGFGLISSGPAKDKTVAARTLDGNAVVLDQQLEKVAETDTAQQLALNLYKKYSGMFKTAIGRG